MSGQMPRFHRHRVRRGDTLWRLAEEAYGHGDLWPQISEANHLRPGAPLLIGLELRFPLVQHTSSFRNRQSLLHASSLNFASSAPPRSTNHTASHSTAQTSVVTNAQHASREGPFLPARPVLFPAFKYELNGLMVVSETPGTEVKLSFKGEITLQREGVITGGLTLSKEGIEAEYKKQSDGVLKDLFSKSTFKYTGKEAEVSLAAGSEIKIGDKVLATTETSIVPPATTKYSYKGSEIKGTYLGYEFAGTPGYELEVSLRSDSEGPQPHVVHATHWGKILGVGLVVAAGVLVVGDLVKDVGTFGVGAAESPLSFAAAAEMFGTGMAMTRAVAH